MSRRIAVVVSLAVIAASAGSAVADAKPLDDACNQTSPNASLCIRGRKLAEAAAAACRATDAPNEACANPAMAHDVLTAQLAAYQSSWVHATAQYQYALGNTVPLGDAQWLGTHNSFNTDSNGLTLSHTDNNQQLTLTQQLDGDVRAIELDVHEVPGPDNGLGSPIVRVCHGRGGDEMHAGCTTEPQLKNVLPEIKTWLDAHPGQVLMIYLEDNLDGAEGYAQVIDAVDATFVGTVYTPANVAGACANLPLNVSRADMLAAGKRVFFVGNCRAGWSSRVFGWDADHVESGSSGSYHADCTGIDYATKLVRFFEDSTWLSAAIDPSETPADHAANGLTPAKVTAMIACGVNLFGFDQFDPNDGRVAASIWSWATGQPDASAGACAFQRPDGRWVSSGCDTLRPAACRGADGWALTPPVPAVAAAAACQSADGEFTLPRTGEENAQLRAAAGGAEVWLDV